LDLICSCDLLGLNVTINKIGIVSIFIGIIGIFIFFDANYLAPVKTNHYHMYRGFVYGALSIAFGIVCFIHGSKTGADEAEIFNFTETKDPKINCMNCKYCDMTCFDGYEAQCKFFKVKINKDSICDIGRPEPKIKPQKIKKIDPKKPVI
jgi:hypothetical protein